LNTLAASIEFGPETATSTLFRARPMTHDKGEATMSSSTLRDFASAAVQSKRIRFGDLRRLKRDILPARITTREEAEVLIALDAVVEKADREWRSYLIGTVRDFVVWGLSPAGQVDRAKADWLVAVLSSGVARKTARTLSREIAREAYQVDEALLLFGAGRRKWQGSKRSLQRGLLPQRAHDSPFSTRGARLCASFRCATIGSLGGDGNAQTRRFSWCGAASHSGCGS
jgi:hypothetical protein